MKHSAVHIQKRRPGLDITCALIVIAGWIAFANNSPLVGNSLGLAAVTAAYITPIVIAAVRLLSHNLLHKSHIRLFLLASCILALLMLSTLIRGPSVRLSVIFYVLTTYSLSLALLLAVAQLPKPDHLSYAIGLSGHIVFLAVFSTWIITGLPIRWQFVFNNVNPFGLSVALAASASFYFVKRWLYKLVIFTAASLLLIAITAKAALLVFVTFCILYASYPILIWRRWTYWFTVLSLLVGLLLFPFLYINLSSSQWRYTLNQISRDIFHQSNFFSGRESIWEELLRSNQATWLLGRGATPVEIVFRDEALSSHNLYLALYSQGGILLLFLFLALLLLIAARLYRLRYLQRTRFAICLCLAFLAGQTFEVSLFQNNLSISFWFWLIVGAGLATGPIGNNTFAPPAKSLHPCSTNST